VQGRIAADFPSPADDFATERHDLNELLIMHPLATSFWQLSARRVGGESGLPNTHRATAIFIRIRLTLVLRFLMHAPPVPRN